MKLVHETRHLPLYYFPIADVNPKYLQKSDHSTNCQHKGDASYWHVRVGDKIAENAVWSYEDPIESASNFKGLMAFYWTGMDQWFEEDEEIFVHARDPYHRVDAVPSSRHVRVTVGGEIIADSTNAIFVFETRMPMRFYIPKEDVRLDLLIGSDLKTACPYKGTANYHSAQIAGKTYPDIVWTYPAPIAECPKIKDLLCFFNEKVDLITIDGVELEKQKTNWSPD